MNPFRALTVLVLTLALAGCGGETMQQASSASNQTRIAAEKAAAAAQLADDNALGSARKYRAACLKVEDDLATLPQTPLTSTMRKDAAACRANGVTRTGSSPTPKPPATKAEYITEADRLCTTEGTEMSPILKQYDAINTIDSTDSTHVATLVASLDLVKSTFLSRLRALTPPPTDTATIARIWDTYSTFIQQEQQFGNAVKYDNFPSADRLATMPADAAYQRLAQAYGFTVCGAATTPTRTKGTTPAPKPRPKPKPAVKPQTFSGNGSTNLGTITIATSSTISWTCPQCSSSAFGMDSFDQADDTDIAIDSQATSGTSAVSAGTYPNVSVSGYGDWSIKITPGG